MPEVARPVLTKLSPWPFVGLGTIACLLFLYGASALFLDWWVIVILGIVWVVLVVLGSRWFATRPARVLPLGVIGLLVWLATIGLRVLLG